MSESLRKVDPADPFAGLNPQQRAAVEHPPEDGPLLVIAGAGSGKTSTLAHRVARLLAQGADPHRILLLTFSRRAAQDMTRRAARIAARVLGADHPAVRAGLPWAGTFHAAGARILREEADSLGLDRAFTIHDREDSADLMNLVRHEAGLSAKDTRFPAKGTCLAIYSRAVNAEAELGPLLAEAFPWCAGHADDLKALFAAYVEAKQAQNVLDYDDLLLYWAQAMLEPGIAAAVAARFDHVLVDEYQDTNRLQSTILHGLSPQGRGLTVVGDDAQAIYSFRAATVRNILDFPRRFDPPARIVTLEENYRSTQPILAASNAVIGLAAEGYGKSLRSDRPSAQRPLLVTVRDEADQARYVAAEVLAAREQGVALKQQAVLFRASHHSAQLEVELARRNIPFVKFGGLRFLEAAHVKDVLAVLRFAGNPADRVTGFRVMQLLPGVGPATAARILDAVAERGGLADGLSGIRPPPAAAGDWPALVDLLTGLGPSGRDWPAELERIAAWYGPHLERRYEDAAARAADLAQLGQIAATYPGRERFLTDLTLDPPEATSAEAGPPLQDEDYLILSTIHSAKGQEWTAVHVLNVVDGCIPSDLATGRREEIEEERRLLYVAMTRAKDALHLVVPQRFYAAQQGRGGDRAVFASRTRFIPPGLLQHFEARAWPPPAAASGAAARPAVQPVDIGARVRGMWR